MKYDFAIIAQSQGFIIEEVVQAETRKIALHFFIQDQPTDNINIISIRKIKPSNKIRATHINCLVNAFKTAREKNS